MTISTREIERIIGLLESINMKCDEQNARLEKIENKVIKSKQGYRHANYDDVSSNILYGMDIENRLKNKVR